MATIDLDMELGKGIGHTFGDIQSSLSYSVLPRSGTGQVMHISCPIYDPAINAPTGGMVGLDLENEAFIFMFVEYPGRYIVASTDESRTPEELLEHFAAFIASNEHLLR